MFDKTKTKFLYFGCDQQTGHYLFSEGMRYPGEEFTRLRNLDGMLAPQHDRNGYIATFARLDGHGVCAISFWDYSVDQRGGSNSTFFATSLTISPEELLAEAKQRFPNVFKRLPKEVVLHQPQQ